MSSLIVRNEAQLAASLRRCRKMAAMTQTELGAATQLRQATISTLEGGKGGTLDSLFAVLTALNLELVVRPRETQTEAWMEDFFPDGP